MTEAASEFKQREEPNEPINLSLCNIYDVCAQLVFFIENTQRFNGGCCVIDIGSMYQNK